MSKKIFCENCGNGNALNAKFCNGCGNPLLEVSQSDQDNQTINQTKVVEDQGKLDNPPVYNPYPTQINETHSVAQQSQSYEFSLSDHSREPFEWYEPSFLKSIQRAVLQPSSVNALYEDPKAPNILKFLLIILVFHFFQSYMDAMSTVTYIENELTETTAISTALSQTIAFAIVLAISTSILTFLIKRSLPANSPIRSNSFIAVFKLQTIRYTPFILFYILKGILLVFEDVYIINSPSFEQLFAGEQVEVIQARSAMFGIIMFFSYFGAHIVSALLFYKTLRGSFGVRNSLPLIISLLIIFIGFFTSLSYLTFILI
jgi:hypothetical protein